MTATRIDKVKAYNAKRGKARYDAVLAAGLTEARDVGFQWITRDAVAKLAKVVPASVSHAFGDMIGLKRAVLREAIRIEDLTIIAQGLAERHPIVMEEASTELRERAARSMVS